MLQIKRLSDGKTWNTNYDSMLPLWNEHYAKDINQQTPDELALFYMNGKWEIVGWNEAEGMNESGYQPIELDPALYSVTDTDSIARSEVRRVMEEAIDTADKFETHFKQTDNVTMAEYMDGKRRQCQAIASALSIDLYQKGAEAPEQSTKGEAK